MQTRAGGFASLSLGFLPYQLEVLTGVLSEAVVRNPRAVDVSAHLSLTGEASGTLGWLRADRAPLMEAHEVHLIIVTQGFADEKAEAQRGPETRAGRHSRQVAELGLEPRWPRSGPAATVRPSVRN